jgi:hypothetical protein
LSCRVSFCCLPDSQIPDWICSNSNNKELCVTETLTSIQTNTGTLTIDKLLQIVPAIAAGEANSLNGTNLCTPCVKQFYNVAESGFPGIFGPGTTVASNVQTDCGSSFVGELTFSA